MSKSTWWIVGILVIIVGWFWWSSSQSKMVSPESDLKKQADVTPTTQMQVTPTVPPKTIVLEQVAVSGQSGTAVFQGDGDNTKVTLAMTGKVFSSPQPAHIHTGKCPSPGAVKYPLNNVVDGESETILTVKIEDLFADLPLALNVHESAEKSSVYTACGDLK